LKTVRFFLALLKTSIRGSISNRNAFLLESVLMIGNNLVFFSMWWIFFQKFQNIGGWQVDDMAASMAMLSGAYGLSNICFGGIKNLGLIILNGDLDPFMTQPKNLLLHLAGSKSRSKGWGHILTALTLLSLGGIKAASIPLLLSLTVSGALIFASVGVIVHSLTFWLGSIESVSEKYLDSLFIFTLYPTNIYSGLLQLVMFTLIPAGLIGYFPVELLRHFSWDRFALLLLSASLFVATAFWVFYSGLKRYESGNKFGMRL
jgi:ABC-2 type transport system permease protein